MHNTFTRNVPCKESRTATCLSCSVKDLHSYEIVYWLRVEGGFRRSAVFNMCCKSSFNLPDIVAANTGHTIIPEKL